MNANLIYKLKYTLLRLKLWDNNASSLPEVVLSFNHSYFIHRLERNKERDVFPETYRVESYAIAMTSRINSGSFRSRLV